MNQGLLRITNLIAIVVTVGVNALANIVPFNGQTTGEISDRFPSYIVPAGFTFSIWGVIYASLLAFAVAQAFPGWLERPLFRRVGWLFVLTCIANSAWVVLWHYEFFGTTLLVMLALLVTLLAIYVRLDADRGRASRLEYLLAAVPFSIYLGWITIATIANTTVVLIDAGWGGWGIAPEVWAVLLLVVAMGIVGAICLARADVAYSAVALWSFGGVVVGQSATPLVAWTATLAAVLSAIVLVIAIVRRRGPGTPFAASPA
jgi:translocator protein